MNAIEFKANGKVFLFTAKSLIADGREYLYTGMSAIKHSSSKHTYIFRYNDAWHQLIYDPADAKKLGTLFARIVKMNQTRLARQQAAAKAAAPVKQAFTVQPSATITGNESFAEALSKAIRESDAKIDAAELLAKEQAEASTPATVSVPKTKAAVTGEPVRTPKVAPEVKIPAEDAEIETAAEEFKSEAATKEPESEAFAKESEPETAAKDSEVTTVELPADTVIEEAGEKISEGAEVKVPVKELLPEEAEKKSKLKKAITIFAIIIVLFILAGIGHLFLFPVDNPIIKSDTNPEQQYNDIDELIEDLQK